MAKKKVTTTIEVKEDAALVKQAKTTAEVYLNKAKDVKIESEDDYTAATDVLLKVKEAAKRAEDEKNKVLKPLKEAVKAETARWKPIEMIFEQINSILRPKMLAFVNAREAKAKAELEKLNKKVDAGQIKREETIERKLEQIHDMVPERRIHTGSGAAGISKVKKLVIVNPDLIPDEFWVIDEVKLRKAVVTEGKTVPGAECKLENNLSIF